MKTLYLECNMGAAGDMLMGALYELLPDKEAFLEKMNSLIPGVKVSPRNAVTCGISGTHMDVTIDGETEKVQEIPCGFTDAHVHAHDLEHEHEHEHDHEHGHPHFHASPDSIYAAIHAFPLPKEVKENACAVYGEIAKAESAVHAVPVTQIHFHEVGTLDAIADVTGVCLAMYLLAPDRVEASPIHLGSGQVRCAHGILPVPTPATAYILKDVPCYGGEIKGELCTPTGAALIKYFAKSFGAMPLMATNAIGCGVGNKEFSAANCLRAFIGENSSKANDEIVELCCHIDDMTAEALAFASEQLLSQGALDTSAAPITMKKGRSGVSYTVLCRAEDEERIAEAMLRETNSNGVRARLCRKYILRPSIKTLATSYGPVQIKCADGHGIHHEKPEYDSVAKIARERSLPFQKVWEDIVSEIKNQAE